MTVAEVIEALLVCDPKAEVRIDEDFRRYVEVKIVTTMPDGWVLID